MKVYPLDRYGLRTARLVLAEQWRTYPAENFASGEEERAVRLFVSSLDDALAAALASAAMIPEDPDLDH